jgi:stearoyl-CoA desaturase (Delta-9 desaturase)
VPEPVVPPLFDSYDTPVAVPVSRRAWLSLRKWFDTTITDAQSEGGVEIDWLRVVPFLGIHLCCLGVISVGTSKTAVLTAVFLYVLRMFAVTGLNHRYFAHRTFRTSRTLQFVLAVFGATSVQRGPLWWAAHHRNHHQNADTALDPHSPLQRGFLWSHMGWCLTPDGFRTDWKRIPDFARYPELRWLDRFDILAPVVLATFLYGLGAWLHSVRATLAVTGAQLFVWGFSISTVSLFHATVTINSLAHRFGARRYATRDGIRNNLWLALLTFGEGWHNNHHFFPGAARQGFRWWEIDLTYYALKLMALCGLVRGLRPVPSRVLAQRIR